MWKIFTKIGNLNDFIQFISNPILLDWATFNISKDMDDEVDTWKIKFDAVKPWLNHKMWSYMEQQKARKESLKGVAAKALGVSSDKVVVVNTFEKELEKLGLPRDEINRLVGK